MTQGLPPRKGSLHPQPPSCWVIHVAGSRVLPCLEGGALPGPQGWGFCRSIVVLLGATPRRFGRAGLDRSGGQPTGGSHVVGVLPLCCGLGRRGHACFGDLTLGEGDVGAGASGVPFRILQTLSPQLGALAFGQRPIGGGGRCVSGRSLLGQGPWSLGSLCFLGGVAVTSKFPPRLRGSQGPPLA